MKYSPCMYTNRVESCSEKDNPAQYYSDLVKKEIEKFQKEAPGIILHDIQILPWGDGLEITMTGIAPVPDK